MTDEEKAIMEEWTKTKEEADAEMYANQKHCVNCSNCADCYESAIEDRCGAYKRSYEELKKNTLVWHKVTCFDKPDENGCITDDNPSELGKQYLIRLKRGDFVIQELTESCDYGFVLEDYEWEDVDAWAKLPEV